MSEAFTLSVDGDGIGRLVFDLKNEKVNTFSLPVLLELEKKLGDALQRKEIKVLAISSGKEHVFIAGADLHAFKPIFRDPSKGEEIIRAGHRVFNKLQNLPFPTVALIQGACLGGGMEFALSCTYRVVSDHPKTTLGLPEVSLGIIPGWGGTQRMPRLVGFMDGLSLVISGKPVNALKAWKMKLADAIFASAFFKEGAEKFLKDCITKEGKESILKRRRRSGLKCALLEKNPIGRALVSYQAKREVLKKTKGHYPAPLVALKLIKDSYALPLEEGLNMEIKTFVDNLTSSFSNAPNLIRLFFIGEELKKDFAFENVKPQEVSSTGVLGAGTMGSGIAWLFSSKEIPVRMKDVEQSLLAKGFGAAHAIYAKLVKDKRLKRDEANLKFHHISGTTDNSGFKDLKLVIEAATENLSLKYDILKEMESIIPNEAILATNTSSLSVNEMSKVLKNPKRFVGMHFFNPVNKMPLVEVAASDQTSPATIVSAVDICRKLGKTPIVVRDCPGFLVNRIFMMGANEIMRMYEEGADRKLLEKTMLDFGMPMSPFELADEVGNDVGFKVAESFSAAYGKRMATPKIVALMYENNLLGKKTGKGFYIYKNGKAKEFNGQAEELRKQTEGRRQESVSSDEILSRTIFSMVNEAARCLEEKIVSKPGYLDMALVMGIGFPPFRGGLLAYANAVGIPHVVDTLRALEKRLGERFSPCKLLSDMQQTGAEF